MQTCCQNVSREVRRAEIPAKFGMVGCAQGTRQGRRVAGDI